MIQRDYSMCNEHGNCSLDSERSTAASLLQTCARLTDIETGRRSHAMAIVKGLDGEPLIDSSLIHMYAKCGFLMRARSLFEKVPMRCVLTWSALIAGYTAFGCHKGALDCLDMMQLEGILPSACAFACSLKACGSIEFPEMGQKLHMQIVKRGLLEQDRILGNSLIDMYARNGCLREAHIVFQEIIFKDLISWTAMIAGYANNGFFEQALMFLKQMRIAGIFPDSVTFICCLKGCSKNGYLNIGKEIHLEVTKLGWEEGGSALGNALIDFYANCSLLVEAQDVLDELQFRDVVSWTALIAGYSKYGHCGKALESFKRMRSEGVIANEISYICILKSCANSKVINEGREIHSEICRIGLFEGNPCLGNVLIEMYANCGLLVEAEKVFKQLPIRDAVSWTALIDGYTNYGYSDKALDCFEQMQHVGVSPDAIAYVCGLKSCATLGAIYRGQEIHAQISCKGLFTSQVQVGNAIVDMYAKCDKLIEAQHVFSNLRIQDITSWNAMISGYVKHEQDMEALDLLQGMHQRNIPLDAVTLICGLKACRNLGSTDGGVKLHHEISVRGFLQKDPLLGNALLEMYSDFGLLSEAHEVFESTPVQDVVSWTLLISGFAQIGEANKAFCLFEKMIKESINPNIFSLVSVLSACSHAGLVEKGHMYFKHVIQDMDIIPSLEHYSCMIDMHGRAGQLDKVTSMVKNMPFHPNRVVWRSILGASRKWGDIMVGVEAFEHAVGFDDTNFAFYINFLNISTAFVSGHHQ